MTDPLAESAERLFSDHSKRFGIVVDNESAFDEFLWRAVSEVGFPAALLPEGAGGFGLTAREAIGIVTIAAANAASIPLAETMLAGRLLAAAGLPVPEGPLTIAPVSTDPLPRLERRGGHWQLEGRLTRVPWARHVEALALHATSPYGERIVLVPKGLFTTAPGTNVAGEPRDAVTIDSRLDEALVSSSEVPPGKAELRAAGAVMRTAQIAGALSRVLQVSVEYAQTRVQFGRPIGQFQAIQHALAQMAGQVAAATAAADMAIDVFDDGMNPVAIGAAKARAGEAASITAAIAHQVHGAIGFTHEYQLHPLTRRLWSWRDEFGNEAEWSRVVGRAALSAGTNGLWPMLTEVA